MKKINININNRTNFWKIWMIFFIVSFGRFGRFFCQFWKIWKIFLSVLEDLEDFFVSFGRFGRFFCQFWKIRTFSDIFGRFVNFVSVFFVDFYIYNYHFLNFFIIFHFFQSITFHCHFKVIKTFSSLIRYILNPKEMQKNHYFSRKIKNYKKKSIFYFQNRMANFWGKKKSWKTCFLPNLPKTATLLRIYIRLFNLWFREKGACTLKKGACRWTVEFNFWILKRVLARWSDVKTVIHFTFVHIIKV